MAKAINFKGLNSVASLARAMGINPKVARAKVRRAIANKMSPIKSTSDELTVAQAKKVADLLTTDMRKGADAD